jgi:hypothetical protein
LPVAGADGRDRHPCGEIETQGGLIRLDLAWLGWCKSPAEL